MAGDAATNTATKLRPSEEKLNQIDTPADDNTWHDAPDFSNVKSQLQRVYKKSPSQDAKDAANTTVEGARQPDGTPSPQAGAETAAGVVSENINANISEEDREAAKTTAAEYRRRAREYLNKKVPQERRDHIVWRLKASWSSYSTVGVRELTNNPRKWFLSASSTLIISKPSQLC